MHGLVIALLIQILVVEYLIESRKLLHPYLILMPEALSAVVMLVVLIRLMGGARANFDWRYGIFIVTLLFTIVVGYMIQDVPDGAMLAGARSYFKFLPFFLLPAVHRFTAKQLRTQMMVVLVLALAQTPLDVLASTSWRIVLCTTSPSSSTAPPLTGTSLAFGGGGPRG